MPRTRLLAAATLLAALAGSAHAQGPAYQRMRTGADSWQARGGHHQSWAGGGYYGHAHAAPYFSPTIIAGSYYQRPYPSHFDYYRSRWGGPPADRRGYEGDPGHPTPDCPCAVPPPVDVVQ